jgi:putative transposase
MAKPVRNTRSGDICRARTFFVTTKTSMGQALFQSERNATLFIDVLRSYVAAKKFQVHDFVVMPNHVHLLITVGEDIAVEKAVQLMKGGFSYRLKKEFEYAGEVWQRGFSDVRIEDSDSFLRHRAYIAQNPVKRGLANSPEEFPFCFAYLAKQKAAGAKARSVENLNGPAKAVP